MNTQPASRADAIAKFILSATYDARASKEAAAELSEQLQEAGADATNKRETMMAVIAATAHREAWTEKEISSSVTLAGKQLQDKKSAKSFSTMAAEIKLAADPDVRAFYPHMVNLRDAAWATEDMNVKAAKKAEMECEAPCKLAFSRSYHMLVAMLRFASETRMPDGTCPFKTSDDVLEFARSRDPRRDPAKIGKQIEGLAKTLREFHGMFPVDSIKTIVDYLGTITAESLKQELDDLAAAQADAAARDLAEAAELAGEGVLENTSHDGSDVSEGGGDVEDVSAVPNEPAAPTSTGDMIDDLLAA